jgi:hypothetical protein
VTQAVRSLGPVSLVALEHPAGPSSPHSNSSAASSPATPKAAAVVTTPVVLSTLDSRQAAAAATFAPPPVSPQVFAPASASHLSTARSTSSLVLAAAAPMGSVPSPTWTSPTLPGLSGRIALASELAVASVTTSAHGGGSSAAHAPGPAEELRRGRLGSAGWGTPAALLVAALLLLVLAGLQPHRLTPIMWRQAAFVSLQERPG